MFVVMKVSVDMLSETKFEEHLNKESFLFSSKHVDTFGHCSLWEVTFKVYALPLFKFRSR